MKELYVVKITEYEDGVQRSVASLTEMFENLEAAERYAASWERKGNRECFWKAQITRVL
jgi:hypothetical protein